MAGALPKHTPTLLRTEKLYICYGCISIFFGVYLLALVLPHMAPIILYIKFMLELQYYYRITGQKFGFHSYRKSVG